MIILVAAGGQMASFAPEPVPTDALPGCSRGKKGAVARRHASYNVGSFSASETSETTRPCVHLLCVDTSSCGYANTQI